MPRRLLKSSFNVNAQSNFAMFKIPLGFVSDEQLRSIDWFDVLCPLKQNFHPKNIKISQFQNDEEKEEKNIKNFSIWNGGKQIYYRFVNGLRKAQEGWNFIWRCPSSLALLYVWKLMKRSDKMWSECSDNFRRHRREKSWFMWKRWKWRWEIDLNVKSDWQLINFEIYLHLNWKLFVVKMSSGSLQICAIIFSRLSILKGIHVNVDGANIRRIEIPAQTELSWQFVGMLKPTMNDFLFSNCRFNVDCRLQIKIFSGSWTEIGENIHKMFSLLDNERRNFIWTVTAAVCLQHFLCHLRCTKDNFSWNFDVYNWDETLNVFHLHRIRMLPNCHKLLLSPSSNFRDLFWFLFRVTWRWRCWHNWIL